MRIEKNIDKISIILTLGYLVLSFLSIGFSNVFLSWMFIICAFLFIFIGREAHIRDKKFKQEMLKIDAEFITMLNRLKGQ